MASSVLPHREHNHRILVVDDNASVRESIVTLLQTEGFDADGVENGREALRALRGGFDACLILLDMMMPVMDGWTFRVEQRQDARLAEIPVVVLTAAVDPAREAKRIGAVAGLHKPLEIDMLLAMADKYCPRRRA